MQIHNSSKKKKKNLRTEKKKKGARIRGGNLILRGEGERGHDLLTKKEKPGGFTSVVRGALFLKKREKKAQSSPPERKGRGKKKHHQLALKKHGSLS